MEEFTVRTVYTTNVVAHNCSEALAYLEGAGLDCDTDLSPAGYDMGGDGSLSWQCPVLCGICPNVSALVNFTYDTHNESLCTMINQSCAGTWEWPKSFGRWSYCQAEDDPLSLEGRQCKPWGINVYGVAANDTACHAGVRERDTAFPCASAAFLSEADAFAWCCSVGQHAVVLRRGHGLHRAEEIPLDAGQPVRCDHRGGVLRELRGGRGQHVLCRGRARSMHRVRWWQTALCQPERLWRLPVGHHLAVRVALHGMSERDPARLPQDVLRELLFDR